MPRISISTPCACTPCRCWIADWSWTMRNKSPHLLLVFCILALSACRDAPPQALGTLEWDRITLPAPVAEKIVRIDVREGQQVAAGAPLLQLELTRTQSQLAAVQAQA